MGNLQPCVIDRKALVDQRAREIVNGMDVRCQWGNCLFHSGHEYCNVDAAWDYAIEIAKDEVWQKFGEDLP